MIGGTVVAEVFGRYADVGDPKQRQTLTEFQAQEVADVLIAFGVPIPQLRVKGFGSTFPEFVPDRTRPVTSTQANAALNRNVIIESTEPVTCV